MGSKRTFFDRFESHERAQHRSISMSASDWRLLEAYRLYGATRAGHEISLQKLIREIVLNHIGGDKTFGASQAQWLEKIESLSAQASEGVVQ